MTTVMESPTTATVSKKKSAKTRSALNPVLALGTNIPDETLPSTPAMPAVNLSPVRLDVAPGLSLVSTGEKALSMQEFTGLPQGRTKTGALTGRPPNIGQYCMDKLGLAFTPAHALQVLTLEKRKVEVANKEQKKQLATEIDEMRKRWLDATKPAAINLLARQDIYVPVFKSRKTGKGYTFQITANIDTEKKDEATILREKLAEQQAHIQRLEAALPKKVVSRITKSEHAHATDVQSTVTQEPAAPITAPVAAQ